MSETEFNKVMAELDEARETHGGDFKRWYETANFPTVEYYCEIGWLLERVIDPKLTK